MAYVRYNHTHERERSLRDDPFYDRPGPLVRRNSKRQRHDIYDDDEYDDYPYNKPSHANSRALTIRAPTQIEKYNVWSPTTHSRNDHVRYDSANEDEHESSRYRYKHTHRHYSPAPHESDDEDAREREFRLKVKATFGRPKSSHSSSSKMMHWAGDVFRSKEKWVGEDWERKERSRIGDGFWSDEPRIEERSVRFRRIKRTKTDEWKPLSGFRR